MERQSILHAIIAHCPDEWNIALCSDSGVGFEPDFFSWVGPCVERAIYQSPFHLIERLNGASVVVTTKLHVGICAAVMGKTVLSFYAHPKTLRFYRQLEREDLCFPLSAAADAAVKHKLIEVESNAVQSIEIPLQMSIRAQRTWHLMKKFCE
jgi:hypothetical protein